jgi:hypothetical protein
MLAKPPKAVVCNVYFVMHDFRPFLQSIHHKVLLVFIEIFFLYYLSFLLFVFIFLILRWIDQVDNFQNFILAVMFLNKLQNFFSHARNASHLKYRWSL